MRILIAVKGREDAGYFQRVARFAPLERAERILLVHVIDEHPRHELDVGRGHHLGHRPLTDERQADLAHAEEERAQAAIAQAREALIGAGIAAGLLQEVVLRGRPKEELRALAEREGAGLIVVAGRREKPGPHSIGKTARFLIDHAPSAALVVR